MILREDDKPSFLQRVVGTTVIFGSIIYAFNSSKKLLAKIEDSISENITRYVKSFGFVDNEDIIADIAKARNRHFTEIVNILNDRSILKASDSLSDIVNKNDNILDKLEDINDKKNTFFNGISNNLYKVKKRATEKIIEGLKEEYLDIINMVNEPVKSDLEDSNIVKELISLIDLPLDNFEAKKDSTATVFYSLKKMFKSGDIDSYIGKRFLSFSFNSDSIKSANIYTISMTDNGRLELKNVDYETFIGDFKKLLLSGKTDIIDKILERNIITKINADEAADLLYKRNIWNIKSFFFSILQDIISDNTETINKAESNVNDIFSGIKFDLGSNNVFTLADIVKEEIENTLVSNKIYDKKFRIDNEKLEKQIKKYFIDTFSQLEKLLNSGYSDTEFNTNTLYRMYALFKKGIINLNVIVSGKSGDPASGIQPEEGYYLPIFIEDLNGNIRTSSGYPAKIFRMLELSKRGTLHTLTDPDRVIPFGKLNNPIIIMNYNNAKKFLDIIRRKNDISTIDKQNMIYDEIGKAFKKASERYGIQIYYSTSFKSGVNKPFIVSEKVISKRKDILNVLKDTLTEAKNVVSRMYENDLINEEHIGSIRETMDSLTNILNYAYVNEKISNDRINELIERLREYGVMLEERVVDGNKIGLKIMAPLFLEVSESSISKGNISMSRTLNPYVIGHNLYSPMHYTYNSATMSLKNAIEMALTAYHHDKQAYLDEIDSYVKKIFEPLKEKKNDLLGKYIPIVKSIYGVIDQSFASSTFLFNKPSLYSLLRERYPATLFGRFAIPFKTASAIGLKEGQIFITDYGSELLKNMFVLENYRLQISTLKRGTVSNERIKKLKDFYIREIINFRAIMSNANSTQKDKENAIKRINRYLRDFESYDEKGNKVNLLLDEYTTIEEITVLDDPTIGLYPSINLAVKRRINPDIAGIMKQFTRTSRNAPLSLLNYISKTLDIDYKTTNIVGVSTDIMNKNPFLVVNSFINTYVDSLLYLIEKEYKYDAASISNFAVKLKKNLIKYFLGLNSDQLVIDIAERTKGNQVNTNSTLPLVSLVVEENTVLPRLPTTFIDIKGVENLIDANDLVNKNVIPENLNVDIYSILQYFNEYGEKGITRIAKLIDALRSSDKSTLDEFFDIVRSSIKGTISESNILDSLVRLSAQKSKSISKKAPIVITSTGDIYFDLLMSAPVSNLDIKRQASIGKVKITDLYDEATFAALNGATIGAISSTLKSKNFVTYGYKNIYMSLMAKYKGIEAIDKNINDFVEKHIVDFSDNFSIRKFLNSQLFQNQNKPFFDENSKVFNNVIAPLDSQQSSKTASTIVNEHMNTNINNINTPQISGLKNISPQHINDIKAAQKLFDRFLKLTGYNNSIDIALNANFNRIFSSIKNNFDDINKAISNENLNIIRETYFSLNKLMYLFNGNALDLSLPNLVDDYIRHILLFGINNNKLDENFINIYSTLKNDTFNVVTDILPDANKIKSAYSSLNYFNSNKMIDILSSFVLKIKDGQIANKKDIISSRLTKINSILNKSIRMLMDEYLEAASNKVSEFINIMFNDDDVSKRFSSAHVSEKMRDLYKSLRYLYAKSVIDPSSAGNISSLIGKFMEYASKNMYTNLKSNINEDLISLFKNSISTAEMKAVNDMIDEIINKIQTYNTTHDISSFIESLKNKTNDIVNAILKSNLLKYELVDILSKDNVAMRYPIEVIFKQIKDTDVPRTEYMTVPVFDTHISKMSIQNMSDYNKSLLDFHVTAQIRMLINDMIENGSINESSGKLILSEFDKLLVTKYHNVYNKLAKDQFRKKSYKDRIKESARLHLAPLPDPVHISNTIENINDLYISAYKAIGEKASDELGEILNNFKTDSKYTKKLLEISNELMNKLLNGGNPELALEIMNFLKLNKLYYPLGMTAMGEDILEKMLLGDNKKFHWLKNKRFISYLENYIKMGGIFPILTARSPYTEAGSVSALPNFIIYKKKDPGLHIYQSLDLVKAKSGDWDKDTIAAIAILGEEFKIFMNDNMKKIRSRDDFNNYLRLFFNKEQNKNIILEILKMELYRYGAYFDASGSINIINNQLKNELSFIEDEIGKKYKFVTEDYFTRLRRIAYQTFGRPLTKNEINLIVPEELKNKEQLVLLKAVIPDDEFIDTMTSLSKKVIDSSVESFSESVVKNTANELFSKFEGMDLLQQFSISQEKAKIYSINHQQIDIAKEAISDQKELVKSVIKGVKGSADLKKITEAQLAVKVYTPFAYKANNMRQMIITAILGDSYKNAELSAYYQNITQAIISSKKGTPNVYDSFFSALHDLGKYANSIDNYFGKKNFEEALERVVNPEKMIFFTDDNELYNAVRLFVGKENYNEPVTIGDLLKYYRTLAEKSSDPVSGRKYIQYLKPYEELNKFVKTQSNMLKDSYDINNGKIIIKKGRNLLNSVIKIESFLDKFKSSIEATYDAFHNASGDYDIYHENVHEILKSLSEFYKSTDINILNNYIYNTTKNTLAKIPKGLKHITIMDIISEPIGKYFNEKFSNFYDVQKTNILRGKSVLLTTGIILFTSWALNTMFTGTTMPELGGSPGSQYSASLAINILNNPFPRKVRVLMDNPISAYRRSIYEKFNNNREER